MTYVAVVIAKNGPGAQGEHLPGTRPGTRSPRSESFSLFSGFFPTLTCVCVCVHMSLSETPYYYLYDILSSTLSEVMPGCAL